MPTAVMLSQSAADLLCCLGLGLALAAVYDAIVCILGKTKLVVLLLDIAVFSFAGILVCSYAAARSYAGVVRWYHLLGMLIGQWAYYHAFCAVTQRIHSALLLCAIAPLKWSYRRIFYPAFRAIVYRMEAVWCKRKEKQKKKQKNESKQLQTSAKMLYNSR